MHGNSLPESVDCDIPKKSTTGVISEFFKGPGLKGRVENLQLRLQVSSSKAHGPCVIEASDVLR